MSWCHGARWLSHGAIAIILIAASSMRAAPPLSKVDYNFHVRPILSDRCFLCHGPDERARKAGLRLDLRESAIAKGAVVPGKPAASKMIAKITAPGDERMPPPRSNLHLNSEEIEILRRWIAEGAEYKPHWSFQALPDAIALPDVKDGRWSASPLDRFVLARFEQEGLRPSAPASREDWLRRVTFDLTGLPPTPAEVDAFLADRSDAAHAKVVDRLLKSPRFGERLTMEWLDVARYADSFGYQADGDTQVWPWRDWVISAFNQNLPFDQFVTWQIAGDLLPNATREQKLATAFCRLHRMTNEGGSIPEEWRLESVADRVHTFGTAFLGLTLECSRCHDHKYDPLTMRDYYSLSAFFNSIDEWGTYDNSAFRPTPTLLLPSPDQEKTIAALAKEAADKEAQLQTLMRDSKRFDEWLKSARSHKPELPGLVGHYPLDDRKGNQFDNLANAKAPATSSTSNVLVPGKSGQALRFTGDDPANFSNVLGSVERWQPFTASFWLHLPRPMKEGIVFHRQSGTDTGFHGAELALTTGGFVLHSCASGPAMPPPFRRSSPCPRIAGSMSSRPTMAQAGQTVCGCTSTANRPSTKSFAIRSARICKATSAMAPAPAGSPSANDFVPPASKAVCWTRCACSIARFPPLKSNTFLMAVRSRTPWPRAIRIDFRSITFPRSTQNARSGEQNCSKYAGVCSRPRPQFLKS